MIVYDNFDLTMYNSYRIKSFCRKAYFPDTESDVLEFFINRSIKKVLLGSGHNIILSKEYYEEDFLIFNGNFSTVKVGGNILEAEAGASMLDISNTAFNYGLSGVEIFYDIPSSLGGAVVMNAGASGEEIKDVLIKVRYLDLEDDTIKEIARNDIEFEYRNSFFQRNTNKIILKAWLELTPSNTDKIKLKMESVKAAREAKQPKEFPNAGSVFKRPKGYFVGAMIDELGLKGFTIGGAKVSEKHGGFIINFNNASGRDIVDLIDIIKMRVYDRFGVKLEVEQRII